MSAGGNQSWMLPVIGNQYEKMLEGARGVKNEAQAAQNKLEADVAAQKKKEEMDAANEGARYQSTARRRALKTNYQRSTILTSPIGVVNSPETSGKTLLGS